MAASRWVLDGVYLRRTNIRRMEETFASPNRRFTVAPARRCLVGPCRRRVDRMGEALRICGSKSGTRRNTEKETRLGFHDRRCDPVRVADGPGGRLGDRRARLGDRLLRISLVVHPSVPGGHPTSRCISVVPRITSVHGGRIFDREVRVQQPPRGTTTLNADRIVTFGIRSICRSSSLPWASFSSRRTSSCFRSCSP